MHESKEEKEIIMNSLDAKIDEMIKHNKREISIIKKEIIEKE